MGNTTRAGAYRTLLRLAFGTYLVFLTGCTAASSAFTTDDSGPIITGAGVVYPVSSEEALAVMRESMSGNFMDYRIRCKSDHPDGIWKHHCSATAHLAYIEVSWSISAIERQGERPDGTRVDGFVFLVTRHSNASVAKMNSLAEDLTERAGRLAPSLPVAR